MILEIIHKKEKAFLSLSITKNSKIGFLAHKDGIKISCNNLECVINVRASFDNLVNAICATRESIFEALESGEVSLVLDLERIIRDAAN